MPTAAVNQRERVDFVVVCRNEFESKFYSVVSLIRSDWPLLNINYICTVRDGGQMRLNSSSRQIDWKLSFCRHTVDCRLRIITHDVTQQNRKGWGQSDTFITRQCKAPHVKRWQNMVRKHLFSIHQGSKELFILKVRHPRVSLHGSQVSLTLLSVWLDCYMVHRFCFFWLENAAMLEKLLCTEQRVEFSNQMKNYPHLLKWTTLLTGRDGAAVKNTVSHPTNVSFDNTLQTIACLKEQHFKDMIAHLTAYVYMPTASGNRSSSCSTRNELFRILF